MTQGLIQTVLRVIRDITGVDLSAASMPPPSSKPAQAWIADYWTMRRAGDVRSAYRLDLDGSVEDDPSDEDIRKAVGLIAGGQKDFAILSRADASRSDDDDDDDVGDDFLQILREPDGSIRLEFGVPGNLGQPVVAAVNGPVSREAAVDALIDYRRRGAKWLDAGSWRYVTAPA